MKSDLSDIDRKKLNRLVDALKVSGPMQPSFRNFSKLGPNTYAPEEIPELVEAREQTSPGEAIFLDRDLRGMTQAELAAKLGEVFGTDPAAFFKF